MKDIEGIVEEFSTKYWKEWTDWDSVEFDKVTDWLRTILQSQADQYEKEKESVRLEERGLIRYAIKGVAEKHGGVVEEVLNHIIDGLDMISEEEATQKYAVDLSE
jgi:hypothetical protein